MLSAMRRWAGRAFRREVGQSLVFITLIIAVLLGMAGLAIDGGRAYVSRTDAQRTADAAALAGAKTVLTSSAQGTTDARAYATTNHDPNATVTVLTVTRPHDAVRVVSHKTVSLTMMRLVGVTSVSINATAQAQAGPPGGAMGLLPWAINDDSFASVGYNAQASLQPANNSGNGGVFNWVSITPPGGQSYANAIANGVNSMLLLNTNYPTNAFDGSGLSVTTANALQARINARPGETYATAGTGSPRIVFVPVVNGGIPNAPTPVKFVGFRAFFLESVNQAQGTVKGRFIKATVPVGIIGGASALDKGVYVVRLTN